jgi:hypothetical protein
MPSDLKILPHWPTSYLQEELAMREGILADTRRKLEAAGIFDADDFREIGADSVDLSWCMHTHLQVRAAWLEFGIATIDPVAEIERQQRRRCRFLRNTTWSFPMRPIFASRPGDLQD